jgi:N-acetylglucosamine kinase-like BadF-type ATPase
MELAESDTVAAGILDSAAAALVRLNTAVQGRLEDRTLPVAFAGGLLAESNPLSQRLCEQLNLADFPQARYTPVVGAALLAKLMIEG